MLAVGVPDQIGQKCGWVVVAQLCTVADGTVYGGLVIGKLGTIRGEQMPVYLSFFPVCALREPRLTLAKQI